MQPVLPFMIVAIFAGSLGAANTPENSECVVPHDPLRWQAAYCMAAAGTDDLEAVQNTPCMAQTAPKKARSVCDQNAYWKERWCKQVADFLKGKTVEDCLKDRKLAPRGVEDGF